MIWQLSDVVLRTGSVVRVRNLNMEIPAGRTAIVGYSGAGKSSLLSLLAGMEQPTSGKIHLHEEVTADSRCSLFWAPQTDGLWSHLSVEAHLATVCPKGAERQEFANKFLNQFDLKSRRAAFPHELSAGEKSRLSVARALAVNPRVLLMDEPLAHVDPARQSKYWNMIDEHLSKNQDALVFTTHDPTHALQYSQQIMCLKAGECSFFGATMDLYERPESKELAEFLGPTNWFEEVDFDTWLPAENRNNIRPERLLIDVDAAGPCRVLSFRFGGRYAETQLERDGQQRTFFHRPTSRSIQIGDRVFLKTI